MQTIKYLLQLVEWIYRYALLSPGERRRLVRRYKPRRPGGEPGAGLEAEPLQKTIRLRYHRVGEALPALPQPERTLPPLAPALMRTITGSVITVTALSLWIVSLGRMEALYNIPVFILAVLAAMLYQGLKRPRR